VERHGELWYIVVRQSCFGDPCVGMQAVPKVLFISKSLSLTFLTFNSLVILEYQNSGLGKINVRSPRPLCRSRPKLWGSKLDNYYVTLDGTNESAQLDSVALVHAPPTIFEIWAQENRV
jgi:hypothetical protein